MLYTTEVQRKWDNASSYLGLNINDSDRLEVKGINVELLTVLQTPIS